MERDGGGSDGRGCRVVERARAVRRALTPNVTLAGAATGHRRHFNRQFWSSSTFRGIISELREQAHATDHEIDHGEPNCKDIVITNPSRLGTTPAWAMADARTLLRQQRAARDQAKKAQKRAAAPPAVSASKKRKATDDSTEEKKRTRTEEAAGVPAGFFDAGAEQEETHVEDEIEAAPQPPPTEPLQTTSAQLDPTAEAELDAFLSEMNKEPEPQPKYNYASGAVIESAPMTAAELAAQAREEQSAQRARRDEDMEAEKEEAARALEDEFEEMEGLDERVKKLREQREALRAQSTQLPVPTEPIPIQSQAHDEESESEDDEDWDDWRFRPA